MQCYLDYIYAGEVYDECVIDLGKRDDCRFAHSINDKSECTHWSDKPRGTDKKRCPHCGEVIE